MPVNVPLGGIRAPVRGYALVDEADMALVASIRWQLHPRGYAVAKVATSHGARFQLMHRLILGVTDPSIHVDHINRNRLDNRHANLRTCTAAQNNQNVAGRGKYSRHRGVSYDNRPEPLRKRWQASGVLNGYMKNLGRYATEEEAAQVAAEWRAVHLPFAVEEALHMNPLPAGNTCAAG